MSLSNINSAEEEDILLSAICPIYNEVNYIHNVLSFFISSDPKNKELILVDGGSTDGTLQIINEYVNKYSNIRVVHNEKKFTPYALNLGIKDAKGEYIIRLDAHSEYNSDYFLKIIELLKQGKGDIVGGPIRMKWKTKFQKIAAFVTNSRFGIGGSICHDVNYTGYSDSVYLGAMKRSLFYEIGYFDEDLIKNQDDEFNYRANSFGKKVYQDSDVISYYYPKDTLKDLAKHYFLFGYYKPIVLRKNKSEAKLRHIIPSLFVLYLLSLPFLNTFIWKIPILIYLLLCLYYSILFEGNFLSKIETCFTYLTVHVSYGAGFIVGLFNLLMRKK